MRRIYLLPLLLLFSLTVVIVAAQENPQPDSPTPVPVVTPNEPDIDVEKTDGADLMSLTSSPFSVSAAAGSDFCESATTLTATDSGSQMNVGALTPPDPSLDDPILNCMWGSPTSSQGYRTVWYKFTPTANGIMTISTLPASTLATNAYDTVLAVHTGVCGDLVTLACNDDTIGFSSTVRMNVRRNITYYIEVADWQAGGNAIKTLDLSIQVDLFTSLWQNANVIPPTLSSRQASVMVGSTLYLIGGRGSGGSILNSFQQLNTATNTWQTLSSMPANEAGNGLLNTTAVYLPAKNGLNARIYIPGGSASSNDSAYSRQHQYYEFRASGLSGWNTAPNLVGGANVTEAFAYAAAARNNANDGYFLTGGVVGQGFPLTTTSTVRDQVLFYQPADDSWVTKASMTSPRYGHVAANVGGRLCVAGGLNINVGELVLIPNGECASGISPSSWAPTGNMQVPRYFAQSSVSPAGKWYVYGGIDATGKVVPEVEFYDPATNSWSVMGLLYDLGGQNGLPVVWPAGGFVGNYLWATSGSYDPTGDQLNPQVGKVQILGNNTFLPLVINTQFGNNHSLADAWPISRNSTISQNFSSTRTLVNFYSFTVPQLSQIQVALTGVASTANVNLYLYGENKTLLQNDESPFPGIDKTITRVLNPGRYYVIVRYSSSSNFPNDLSDYYQLRVGG